ncbi:hypothetical protein M758_11G036300 [Ceratodon purpureus]|nr:hypothetical protein M758_11G036300 [Ceratodon purpureus]
MSRWRSVGELGAEPGDGIGWIRWSRRVSNQISVSPLTQPVSTPFLRSGQSFWCGTRPSGPSPVVGFLEVRASHSAMFLPSRAYLLAIFVHDPQVLNDRQFVCTSILV